MSDITPELVAEELKHQLMPVPLATRPILLEAITSLISKHVAVERTRCRALCEQRAELTPRRVGWGVEADAEVQAWLATLHNTWQARHATSVGGASALLSLQSARSGRR